MLTSPADSLERHTRIFNTNFSRMREYCIVPLAHELVAGTCYNIFKVKRNLWLHYLDLPLLDKSLEKHFKAWSFTFLARFRWFKKIFYLLFIFFLLLWFKKKHIIFFLKIMYIWHYSSIKKFLLKNLTQVLQTTFYLQNAF